MYLKYSTFSITFIYLLAYLFIYLVCECVRTHAYIHLMHMWKSDDTLWVQH